MTCAEVAVSFQTPSSSAPPACRTACLALLAACSTAILPAFAAAIPPAAAVSPGALAAIQRVPMPEPMSIALLALGLLGIVIVSRRRRTKSKKEE